MILIYTTLRILSSVRTAQELVAKLDKDTLKTVQAVVNKAVEGGSLKAGAKEVKVHDVEDRETNGKPMGNHWDIGKPLGNQWKIKWEDEDFANESGHLMWIYR